MLNAATIQDNAFLEYCPKPKGEYKSKAWVGFIGATSLKELL